MRTLTSACLAVIAAVALSGVAHAEGDGPPKLTFSIGATTDYVLRGVSQTNEDPQVFGSVDATIGDLGYAGVWASNVNFDNRTKAEFDLYGGVRPSLGPVSLDLGAIYYGYVDKPSHPDEAYWELKALGTVPAGPLTLGASVYYSPDYFGGSGKATYIEANAALPIPTTRFSVSGALGHQYVEGPRDYTTWNLGIGYALNDHIGFDLRYWDTDEHSFGKVYDGRVVLGVKASF
jgi:uncharacterized protein (TIGR02001 family)